MTILVRCVLFLVLVPLAAFSQEKECSKVVISADSDYAPLHWYDGKHLTGASIEIATTALSTLGIPYEVRYVGPFHRVLKSAREGEIDMISSLKDTPERREYLSYTNVPLFSNPIAIFVAKDRNFHYAGWNDLIGKKGGVTLGNQFGNGFDEFLRKNLDVTSEQKAYMNFKKLELRRIDYLITGYYSGLIYLAESGQTDKFVALKPYVSESDNFIAISQASPCVKYLKSLNQQLDGMRREGKLKSILDKHIALLQKRGTLIQGSGIAR
ncbi:periplasmic component of amino acid ABC-type transporter/signal transduction system [Herbaspirillum sp. CF444]|uniref:substrate-binding periplasmic protein n=1 Tax=Herbaspirillum sp. CF444 TaxID=1144319 RepID=UPI000272332D|nr:transporter substrate-binding domain-containing protein [Herbaspirillum sp. CF444]EJL94382.1 periplasmic component of amino acid ABC-type transporter/signal transduction system [Herbaspirillum sp. CF444]